jgi:nocardicin N-oxygenase
MSPRVWDYPNTPTRRLAPNPLLIALLRDEPVARVRLPFGGDAWLVTRHADVRTVLVDRRFSRAAAVSEHLPRSTPRVPRPDSLLAMDPPEHTRLRELVVRAFTNRRVERLRPRVQALTDQLLAEIAEEGKDGAPVDLVARLCSVVPVVVLCELLGVPVGDRPRFQEWSTAFVSSTDRTLEQIMAADRSLREYLAGLVAERRENPTDDLLGALVSARDDAGRLTEDELVTFGVTLLIAGNESTAGQLANFSYLLLTRPERISQLREEPGLIPGAIEELLRCVPSLAGAGFARVALEDVELGGVRIREGDAVLVSEIAANHDSSVFDHPEDLDLRRPTNPHLAFGYGMHRCLGAQLARLELQVVIGSLLARFPGLRLAVDAGAVAWRQGSLAHGVLTLPVRW